MPDVFTWVLWSKLTLTWICAPGIPCPAVEIRPPRMVQTYIGSQDCLARVIQLQQAPRLPKDVPVDVQTYVIQHIHADFWCAPMEVIN